LAEPATKVHGIDTIAKSFEVTGCGKTVLYIICAHPRVDGDDGAFSIDASVTGLDPDQAPVLTFDTNDHADLHLRGAGS
jgi:hypothetical protein